MSILIYDDNEENLRVMEGTLSSAGYDIETSSNIIDSIRIVEENSKNIDLIVTNFDILQFSLKDYLYILRKLNRNISVVVLSSSSDYKDEIESIDLCVDEYIKKPVPAAVLQKRVVKLLESKGNENSLYIKSDGIIVDTTSHVITKNGEIKHISMKEYQILIFLIRNSNRILSREEIYEKVWFDKYTREKARTVDVHICNIIGKLDITCLISIRGKGYKLEDI